MRPVIGITCSLTVSPIDVTLYTPLSVTSSHAIMPVRLNTLGVLHSSCRTLKMWRASTDTWGCSTGLFSPAAVTLIHCYSVRSRIRIWAALTVYAMRWSFRLTQKGVRSGSANSRDLSWNSGVKCRCRGHNLPRYRC